MDGAAENQKVVKCANSHFGLFVVRHALVGYSICDKNIALAIDLLDARIRRGMDIDPKKYAESKCGASRSVELFRGREHQENRGMGVARVWCKKEVFKWQNDTVSETTKKKKSHRKQAERAGPRSQNGKAPLREPVVGSVGKQFLVTLSLTCAQDTSFRTPQKFLLQTYNMVVRECVCQESTEDGLTTNLSGFDRFLPCAVTGSPLVLAFRQLINYTAIHMHARHCVVERSWKPVWAELV